MPTFVIEFNRRTRARRVREFTISRDAMTFRLQQEDARQDPDIEIVALTSRSLDTLRRTHSRYFTGADLSGHTPVA